MGAGYTAPKETWLPAAKGKGKDKTRAYVIRRVYFWADPRMLFISGNTGFLFGEEVLVTQLAFNLCAGIDACVCGARAYACGLLLGLRFFLVSKPHTLAPTCRRPRAHTVVYAPPHARKPTHTHTQTHTHTRLWRPSGKR